MTMAGFLILPQVVSYSVAGPLFSFALGGVEGMIYALGVILLGQTFRGANLAAASVLFAGMLGAGTMLGPAIVGAGMDYLGNESLPWLLSAIYAVAMAEKSPVVLISSIVAMAVNSDVCFL
jgi:hypothetical protein